MPIQASEDKVTILPAESERTYDKWWIQEIIISCPDPAQPKRVFVRLKKARQLDGGVYELSPTNEEAAYAIGDLDAEAAGNASLAQVVGGLISVTGAIGTSKGVL